MRASGERGPVSGEECSPGPAALQVVMGATLLLALVASCGGDAVLPPPTPEPAPEPALEPAREPTAPASPEPAPEPARSPEPARTTAGGACVAGEQRVLATLREREAPSVRVGIGPDGGFVGWSASPGDIVVRAVDSAAAPTAEAVTLSLEGATELLGLLPLPGGGVLVSAFGSPRVRSRAFDEAGLPLGRVVDTPMRPQSRARTSPRMADEITAYRVRDALVLAHVATMPCHLGALRLTADAAGVVSAERTRHDYTQLWKVCDDTLGHRLVQHDDEFALFAPGRTGEVRMPLLLVRDQRPRAFPRTAGEPIARGLRLVDDAVLQLVTQGDRRFVMSIGLGPGAVGDLTPIEGDALPAELSDVLAAQLRGTPRDGSLRLSRQDAMGEELGPPVEVGSFGDRRLARRPTRHAALGWTGERFVAAWVARADDALEVRARALRCAADPG